MSDFLVSPEIALVDPELRKYAIGKLPRVALDEFLVLGRNRDSDPAAQAASSAKRMPLPLAVLVYALSRVAEVALFGILAVGVLTLAVVIVSLLA